MAAALKGIPCQGRRVRGFQYEVAGWGDQYFFALCELAPKQKNDPFFLI